MTHSTPFVSFTVVTKSKPNRKRREREGGGVERRRRRKEKKKKRREEKEGDKGRGTQIHCCCTLL
jgi:hypothetical protein